MFSFTSKTDACLLPGEAMAAGLFMGKRQAAWGSMGLGERFSAEKALCCVTMTCTTYQNIFADHILYITSWQKYSPIAEMPSDRLMQPVALQKWFGNNSRNMKKCSRYLLKLQIHSIQTSMSRMCKSEPLRHHLAAWRAWEICCLCLDGWYKEHLQRYCWMYALKAKSCFGRTRSSYKVLSRCF